MVWMYDKAHMVRPFRLSDLPIYQGWFSDSDTQRWVSRPDDHWWVYVSTGDRSACWALEDAGVLGGVLQVDRGEKGHAFVCLLWTPPNVERAWGSGSYFRSWPTIVKISRRSQLASRPRIEQASP